MLGDNFLILQKQAELSKFKESFLSIYKEYEDLQKDSYAIYHSYNLVFGESYHRRYLLYCECERTRRRIELCQYYLNRQEKIDHQEILKVLDNEFKEYEKKLQRIYEEYQAAQAYDQLPRLTNEEISEIKRIYIKIAKAIHPDLNLEYDKNHQELWFKTLSAYKNNDLETLKLCEFLLDYQIKVEEKQESNLDILQNQIESYQQRIEEYQDKSNYIINTFPYNQKDLLNNETLVKEKLQEVEKDIVLFETRLNKLKEQLRKIDPTYEKEIC